MEHVKNPISIIIFGATGDLSTRKLYPSLFELYLDNLLPEKFRIVGFSRGDKTNEAFRQIVVDSISKKYPDVRKRFLLDFVNHFEYVSGEFNEPASYQKLSDFLKNMDKDMDCCTNKMVYLAVPPNLYDPILDHLATPGSYITASNENGTWTRILIEKPFGSDSENAKRLDFKLGQLFKEEQIFRIDHYLQKETIQNILMFRFSNLIFEPVWHRQYIESIEIKLHESIGIEGRGLFYEGVGMLVDVGQNHVLQMLAAICMGNPKDLKAEPLREKKAKLLGELCFKSDVPDAAIRGQYKGYTTEANVDANSKIETHFRIKAFIDSDRWKGVPIYLEAGKKMPSSNVEININFRKKQSVICDDNSCKIIQNKLTFKIQPNEGIMISLWIKKPGYGIDLEERALSFEYKHSEDKLKDAYVEVLYDCIIGDQTRFISTKEAELAWKFISEVKEYWKDKELNIY